jgi:import inner membrane translocase subunit TIM50
MSRALHCIAALNIPIGTPAPPLLVVDVERTLIATEHDPRYGYRHVKRKGVDKFIEQLSNYYEVVLFCENDIGMMEHVIMAIDKDNRTHKLGPSAGEIRNGGDVLKRLDCMNRDVRRIVLVDDSETATQLCRRNTILVKPFTDVHDPKQSEDNTLLDLIPVLQALVHDDKLGDFRSVLEDLGGTGRQGGDKGFHRAEQLAEEYQMRVTKHRMGEQQKKNRGLGRLLRGAIETPPTNGADAFAPPSSAGSSQLKASPTVSPDGKVTVTVSKKEEPTKKPVKKKGAFFEWLGQREADKEEEAAVKREEMETLYRQKMQAKQEAAARQSGF